LNQARELRVRLNWQNLQYSGKRLSRSFHSDASRCRKVRCIPQRSGQSDIAAQALRMLQHAQPGLHLSCLDLQNPPKQVLDCGCSHFTFPERELASIAHILEN
jgi:hypothetical protein